MSKSILTKYEDISVFSQKQANCRHHLVYGRYGSLRDFAEREGLWIPLENSEHNMSSKGTINQIHGNPIAEKLSKMLGQVAYEKRQIAIQLSEQIGKSVDEIETEVREKFRKQAGESFL